MAKDQSEGARLDKRSKIIEAAAGCFLRLGYAETSLDEIVTNSGVVKQTIYNYFDNKDAVFNAAVEHLLSGLSIEFSQDWYQLPPQEFFQKVGKALIKTLAEPQTTAFLRLLVKECRRFPRLQRVYAESIPQPFIEFVGNYILSSKHFADDINERNKLVQATVWCFRASVTGFATLANLGPMLSYGLPSKTVYLDVVSALFSSLLYSPDYLSKSLASAVEEVDELESERAIEDFLSAQLSSLGEKKLVIIAAAIRIFSEKGYADTSMEEIARVANVSKQTVYKHFRSKNYLYAFIAKCVLTQLQSLSLPDSSLPLSEYLSEYTNSFVVQSKRLWIREYFRLVLGESQAFPLESGALLIYIMDHGRA
ncbi:MAG: TetR/AcrR family transcriptional regulator, partial [Candidatus Obscuribacterales bacterium]|nr:TetR/AcrR family transcriptional regulator [Candidatus Obscuribacterales bacterium]